MALYHQTSGGPVEVKRHQIMGPVGYTKVGSPTIVDGVASGFSGNNYIKTPSGVNMSAIDEMVIKVNFTDNSKSQQFLACVEGDGQSANFMLRAFPYGIKLTVDTNISFIGSYSLGTDYWLKLKRNSGNSYSAGYSTDGINYTITETKNLQIPNVINPLFFGIPAWGGDSTVSLDGSIDFNHTYIKVNGELWFYQPQETKYIIREDKLVWADPRIYLEGTGTQYINTGIITNSNYTYETKVKFVKLASGDTNNILFCNNMYIGGDDGRIGCMYRSNGNNTKCIVYNYYTLTLSSWTEYDYDVPYTLKTVKDSSNTYFYINNTLDNTKPLETLTTAQSPVYFWTDAYTGGSALGKIFNVKLFDENKALVGHFVPVPTGLVIGNFTVPSNGMFDMVNQQFYANQGTGEFTIGRDE